MKRIETIILAAGLGTRMKSPLPKVLHSIAGTPMITLLLKALHEAQQSKLTFKTHYNVVVGHGREQVESEVTAFAKQIGIDVYFTHQAEQLGTAHAVRLALENKKSASLKSDVVAVFNGDLPLFEANDFIQFLDAHLKSKSVASLCSTTLENPSGYGRILRRRKDFIGCVEHKDASVKERKISEINGGVYLFDRSILQNALANTGNKNASKEFYLPDVFAFAFKKKKKILAHSFKNPDTLRGVNNLVEIAEAESILLKRVREKWMAQGIRFVLPDTTIVGVDVRFVANSEVGPHCTLLGKTFIDEGTRIGSHCELENVLVGKFCHIKSGVVARSSIIGADCSIGPMVHLRPGTELKDKVKLGNFVEIKESIIGDRTSASHLSYIGDADIGSGVNIGCGFVTCNYDGVIRDGRKKHRSKIGDNVFIGSDSQVVAPIEIADGTFIASGSTITESVHEEDSLALARSKQITKPGYAKKYRNKKLK